MLSLTFSIGRPWETFIHMWRVEFIAALFLAACIVYALAKRKTAELNEFSHLEFNYIILPIVTLIGWSTVSIAWAASWRSALHHSLVWSVYLVFFVFARRILVSKRAVKLGVAVLVGCLAFTCIPAFWGYVSYQMFGGGLRTGITFQKYGEQIITLLPLVLLLVIRLKGSKFAYGLIGIASLWILVLCGLGRINLILFVAGYSITATVGWLAFKSSQTRRRIVTVSLILLAIPAAFFLGAKFSGPETATLADRIVGNEGTQSSNSFRILMATLSFEMIGSHPIKGIGADNFGFQLNDYRSAYGTRNPQDPNLAHAESEIPERAHNELLQIVAELGLVGGAIVGWLLLGIVLMAVRALRLRLYSTWRLAAYFGLIIFLTSSLVSSYSFRLIQNGFVFFFLLAICSKYFLNCRQQERPERRILPDARIAASLGLAACLLLATYSTTRVSSVIAARAGDNTKDTELAADYYQLAMKLDKENPSAPATLGMRLFFERRFSESAPLLENSIAIGKATSTDFSYLASAYTLRGDKRSAERTMARAVAMYPRSVFVLVRYGLLAQANGNAEIASNALERARALDTRSTNSWIQLITNGPLRTSELSFKDKDAYVPVMDLSPEQAMYAVLDEREIIQPEERRKVGF